VTRFRVWAPRKRAVDLVLAAGRQAMNLGDGGWWSAEVDAPGEVDYCFAVDDGPPLPDPRAPRLPYGVHGASRTVDYSAFSWTDAGFRAPPLASAVIYELHVGTFSQAGTFAGAIEHLDHLVELGVTHVELMPVNSFAGSRNWGYDGVGLFAPQESYGGPAGLVQLVDACHRRGLAVLIDVVYNHLGPEGNYLPQYGPYFSDRYRTPWGPAVNLDGRDSDEVRQFFVDNATMWLRDYHADGLRVDAVETLFDRSATHFLEQLATAVDALQAQLGRPLILIAESDLNDPRLVRPREAGGYGIDAQWSDDLHHALRALLTGERRGYYQDFGRIADLTRALTRGYVYDGRYSAYRQRRHGAPIGSLSGQRFLAYSQTHDQVGNQPRGQRLCHLVSSERARLAAALVLVAPFVPMLFAGEEWAASTPFCFFVDFGDPTLNEAVRSGRRAELTEFGWDAEPMPDPAEVDTFAGCTLKWSELQRPEHQAMLDWYRRLIALRRSEPDLSSGRLDDVHVAYEEPGWLRLRRGRIVAGFNFGADPVRMDLPEGDVLLSSVDSARSGPAVELPPNSLVLVKARQAPRHTHL
jgi:maltooligosyltrehalose trehalohydrolase